MLPPVAALLPDGKRLHLQHGPIDLVAEADGDAREVQAAYGQAARAFPAILPRLVEELAVLRSPLDAATTVFGPVARRMAAAVRPHCAIFITPMAAVAGAVADEILAAMVADRALSRVYVNNGGDIALHLAGGSGFSVGMVADVDAPELDGIARITAGSPVRGIATSGWRGRSFSLGIADSVTVLAETAAAADAAATLIANAVDVDHPGIARAPAISIQPDSDLGERLVTVGVAPLPSPMVAAALAAGALAAQAMLRRGLIQAACLRLQGRSSIVDAGVLHHHRNIAVGERG